MEYGAHLPLIELGGRTSSLEFLRRYASVATKLGYRMLCANDHLLFAAPWLDGPTALAAVVDQSGDAALATTVCLPVIRGPVQAAKTLAAIDVLSGGRLLIGVGPGSSARDYAAAGLDFEERWPRFDEATAALRALLHEDQPAFEGRFYSTRDLTLEPRPAQRPGPPIWVGSWGSPAGLRRVARLADGWLASAYNTTPESFAEARSYLTSRLADAGRDQTFPNGLATMWLYTTERRATAERVLTDVLAPMVNRPIEQLRDLFLPIGSAADCAEKVAAFAEVGVDRIAVWPLGDELRQLELFQERIVPLAAH